MSNDQQNQTAPDWRIEDCQAMTASALAQENAALRAVARAAADYLGWQDGTIPDAQRASGAAHRLHLLQLLKAACPEFLHEQ